LSGYAAPGVQDPDGVVIDAVQPPPRGVRVVSQPDPRPPGTGIPLMNTSVFAASIAADPTFLTVIVIGLPVPPGVQLYASMMSCSLVCAPPLEPKLPSNPMANTYSKIAAATAMAMRRSAAITCETPRLLKCLFMTYNLNTHLHASLAVSILRALAFGGLNKRKYVTIVPAPTLQCQCFLLARTSMAICMSP
jgi:hypothetical protein